MLAAARPAPSRGRSAARARRYYEAVGLLGGGEREAGRHRTYDEADVPVALLHRGRPVRRSDNAAATVVLGAAAAQRR